MGWTYNTVNPDAETNAPTIAAVGIVFTTVAFITVCLRMYVRLFMIKAAGFDDWVIVFTWFMSLGFMVVTLLQSKWGLGLQNLADMPDENIFNFGLIQYCGAPFYILSILGFKLSLLLSFLRIAAEKLYKTIIICITVACVAFHFCFLMVQINLCSPVSKQWDPAVVGGKCLVAVPFYTSMASITILFDVIIICTPMPMLIKSQLPRRKKVILIGIFSMGAFITVIQIIRILTIKSLANYIDSSQLIMWSMVENNLGIIVTCIPPLSPLIRYFHDGSKNRSGGRSANKKSAYALQSISKTGDHKGWMDIENGAVAERKGSVMHKRSDFGTPDSSTDELTPEGIRKTTSVMITTDLRDGSTVKDDEMPDFRFHAGHGESRFDA